MSIIANKIKGLTIEIGGETTALNKALGEVNKHSRDLQSELRNVERLLKLDPKNTELLAQKQKILAESITNTKSKLDTLKEAERQAQEQFAKGDIGVDQYRAIQREVIKTEQELKKLDKGLKDTNDKWKDLTDNLDKVGTKMKKFGEDMTKKLTLPLAAAGAASFKVGADFEQAMGKMEVVFEHSSRNIEKWAQNSLRDFGLARSTAIEMVGDFGALFKGMGINIQKTEEWSKTLTERTMDLANFYDTTVDETINALNSIVTGQTEPLRRFGINMTQATLQEYAYSKGIRKKIQDMTEAEKVQLRYNFVVDRTAIAVGTTARESDTATGQLNKFKESIKELALSFSEQVLPLFLPFIEALNSLIEKFTNLGDGTKKFIVVLGGIVAAIGPIILILGSLFKGIKNISDGVGSIPKILEGASKAGKAFKGMLDTTQFLGFLKWALIIGGIVALIGFLINQLNVLLGKGKEANQALNSIGNIAGSMTGANNNNLANRYINGSHRDGLSYVPRDNYIAQLHEGERVLTKTENQRYSQGGGDVINITIDAQNVEDFNKVVKLAKEFRVTKRAGVVRG